jgi:putative membrane protein
MFHMYDGYHWFGMHLAWWFVWLVFFSILFGRYDTVPRTRNIKDAR